MMYKQNKLKKYYPIVSIVFVLLFLIILFVFVNNKGTYSNNKNIEANLLEKTQENVEDQNINTETKLKRKLYLSITDSPELNVIRKVIQDQSSVDITLLQLNPDIQEGNCNLEIFKIEGVAVNSILNINFTAYANSNNTSANFSLGEGMYRTDISCKFGDISYADIYTLELRVEERIKIPSSYPE